MFPGEGRGPVGKAERMENQGFVYIMASSRNGTIYIGVTSDLPKRVWEHRTGAVDGFTKKYDAISRFGINHSKASTLPGIANCR